jgi:hypothetical protein
MAPSPRKRYRCRYCGLLFNAWRPWDQAPDGVLLFGHLSLHHADQMGPYRARIDAGEAITAVAACPNAAAMLFTSARITHLNSLPQGQPQRDQRTLNMVVAMANEGFGSCTNHGECEAVCPKGIPLEFIGKMNRDLMRAVWRRRRELLVTPAVIQQPFHEHVGTEAEGA